jgi:hypothetical protein
MASNVMQAVIDMIESLLEDASVADWPYNVCAGE